MVGPILFVIYYLSLIASISNLSAARTCHLPSQFQSVICDHRLRLQYLPIFVPLSCICLSVLPLSTVCQDHDPFLTPRVSTSALDVSTRTRRAGVCRNTELLMAPRHPSEGGPPDRSVTRGKCRASGSHRAGSRLWATASGRSSGCGQTGPHVAVSAEDPLGSPRICSYAFHSLGQAHPRSEGAVVVC